ncbi:LysR substrate-binding domain-containing protein [Acidiphilium sp. AL]|uniref:LysR substrate-binding domain-containing protein n=1 Tax=Acidiphilium sp. AL TaxID=2871704 RepID=UPI0021CB78BE|nr:LysR substrate-binding domain-containing protein [Acidiphilium sp. AL]
MTNGNWRLILPSLAVFEAAGRHLNFSGAARELGTTQPAVSHHMSWLETELGCLLFRRLHRGVSLTPEGRVLFDAVSSSRQAIEHALTEIHNRSGRKLVNIATDYGFAGDWLIPHLAALPSSVSDVEVRIVASQSAIDPRTEAADFVILLGSGQWPGCVSTLLFRETVYAVASPLFLAKCGPVKNAAELARLRLLHLESRDRCPWLTWSGWFAGHGVALNSRQGDFFFNTYSLVQQAAIAGQGIALGWRPLIDHAIHAGLLVPVLDQPVSTDMGYYLVEGANRSTPPAFARFRDWLVAECARAGAGPRAKSTSETPRKPDGVRQSG